MNSDPYSNGALIPPLIGASSLRLVRFVYEHFAPRRSSSGQTLGENEEAQAALESITRQRVQEVDKTGDETVYRLTPTTI